MKIMSRYIVAFSVLALGSISAAPGCAVDVAESDPAGDPAPLGEDQGAIAAEPQAEGADCDSDGQSTREVSADPSLASASDELSGEAGIIAPLGKKCWATCTVAAIGNASCPPTIGGYGYTTFLGGCNKACNKAKGDAASKLPAGCVLNNCNFSGC